MPVAARDDADTPVSPAATDTEQLQRLLELREILIQEQRSAQSPAVARSLEMADYYLFVGLTYCGYTEKLFPEQK